MVASRTDSGEVRGIAAGALLTNATAPPNLHSKRLQARQRWHALQCVVGNDLDGLIASLDGTCVFDHVKRSAIPVALQAAPVLQHLLPSLGCILD
eukprot:5693933-Pyramimonas_sp.AAC.1